MNKSWKWLIWLVVIMILSFIVSGFFFLKSGLIHVGTGKVNSEVVIELERFSFEFNELLGISVDYDNCYEGWCLENGSER